MNAATEKRISLPGPIGNRDLGEASASLASGVGSFRGALCGRAEGPVASKPKGLSFGDVGGFSGLPALKPLEPEDGRTAKGCACKALGMSSRCCKD